MRLSLQVLTLVLTLVKNVKIKSILLMRRKEEMK